MRSSVKALIALLIGLGLLAYWGYQTFGGPKDAAAASVAVSQRGNTVVFFLKLQDASGRPVSRLKLPNGKRMPPPTLEVLNQAGQRVYMARMEYG